MNDRIDGVLLKSQQAYLRKLGFYSGDIDGFWGPETKAAMVKYRDSDKFAPANKRRGDGPFIPFERLPKGFEWGILDGQRCVREVSHLPASFAMQELVNLILKPTTAKVEKTAPAPVQVEKSQTTNLDLSAASVVEASKTAAASVVDENPQQSATDGQSAKGSSTQFQKPIQHNPQKR